MFTRLFRQFARKGLFWLRYLLGWLSARPQILIGINYGDVACSRTKRHLQLYYLLKSKSFRFRGGDIHCSR